MVNHISPKTSVKLISTFSDISWFKISSWYLIWERTAKFKPGINSACLCVYIQNTAHTVKPNKFSFSLPSLPRKANCFNANTRQWLRLQNQKCRHGLALSNSAFTNRTTSYNFCRYFVVSEKKKYKIHKSNALPHTYTRKIFSCLGWAWWGIGKGCPEKLRMSHA